MKKTTLVLVMAAVLVLSFSAVAMAKYAGYAYNNPLPLASGGTTPNAAVGYLSWDGAKALMTENGVDAALLTTPHGGYTAATSKCAVCHSTHRAATDRTSSGVGEYWKLTPGGMSCVACHTANGSNPVPSALVEWADTYSDGGPHDRQNCLGACHSSIHGAGGSEYAGMRAYNLTPNADALIAAAFAAGNTVDSTSSPAGSNPTGTYGIINEEYFKAGTTEGLVDGRTANQIGQDLSNFRAFATGYTCGQAGCHTSSQFAVNVNGYAEMRAGDPADSAVLNTAMTGHITNMPSGCGPCHGRSDSKCALCHDMIGQATNSSAFPHSNRNITILERLADGQDWTPRAIGRTTNLWMYSGDATYRDAAGEPSTTPASGTTAAGQQARTLIEGNAAWSAPVGNIVDGTCLKCHGYQYWPTHGLQTTGGHALGADVNFSEW